MTATSCTIFWAEWRINVLGRGLHVLIVLLRVMDMTVLVNCVLPARDSNCPQQRPGEPGNLGSKSRLHLWVIHYCVCTLPTWFPRAETVSSVYFTDLAVLAGDLVHVVF